MSIQHTPTIRLPASTWHIVEAYLHITVGGASAACPYHINPGLRSTRRALLGKGSPQEIEQAAERSFKTYDMHVNGSDTTLRSFLIACGLGVDCSGFATWVLNDLTTTMLGRPLWKCLKFPGIRGRLVSRLRPVENISAKLLTSPANARPLPDLTTVRPGDLIRLANGHHVVLITEVAVDTDNNARSFNYGQSSCMYGHASGVRTGHAIITDPRAPLHAQTWEDNDKNHIIEKLIVEGGDDSKVVRLRALAEKPM